MDLVIRHVEGRVQVLYVVKRMQMGLITCMTAEGVEPIGDSRKVG